MSNLMKIRPVVAELFYPDRQTDGRTDRHEEAINRFSQFFLKAPKMATCNIFLYFFPINIYCTFPRLLRTGTIGLKSCYSL